MKLCMKMQVSVWTQTLMRSYSMGYETVCMIRCLCHCLCVCVWLGGVVCGGWVGEGGVLLLPNVCILVSQRETCLCACVFMCVCMCVNVGGCVGMVRLIVLKFVGTTFLIQVAIIIII